MNDEDDFDAPTPPARLHNREPDPQTDPYNYASEPLALNINKDHVDQLEVTNIEKDILINDLQQCNMYLHNLHANFKSTTTVNSVITNVMACLTVHKHKRQLVKDLVSNSRPKSKENIDDIEFDAHGKIIKRA